jgi:AraC-like DNA-binding protein
LIYQYIAPDPTLQEFVRDFLIAHFTFDKEQDIPFKPYSPKPEQTITFLPKGNLTIKNPLTGEAQIAPVTFISGQQLSRYNFHLTSEYLMLRVHFHPGALFRLLRIPLSEFTDCSFDAESVIGREISDVNERLANCLHYAQMITVVNEYLITKLRKITGGTHPLDQVAAHLFTDPTRFSLDWLATQSCLCQRQFNRKFIERMGVGPKLYSRVVRFYKAYQYKETHPQQDWLTIAFLFGYADYQHLVKDFKVFAQGTPNQWIHQDSQSPERVLHLE